MPRYSLRTLMIVVTLVAVGCGLFAMAWTKERATVLVLLIFVAYIATTAWFARKVDYAKSPREKTLYTLLVALMVGFAILSLLMPAVQ